LISTIFVIRSRIAHNARSAWRSSEKILNEAKIFFRILPSGQLYAVPKGRRTAVREAERALRRDPEGIAAQRKRLCAGWEIEFRQPITEVEFCNIVDILFNCQIYNVLLELKPNNSTNVEAYYVCPTCTKPLAVCSLVLSILLPISLQF
jgi:hypothetical protein